MEDFPLLVDAVKTFLNPTEQKQLVESKNQMGFQWKRLDEHSDDHSNKQSVRFTNQEKNKKKQGFLGYRETFDNPMDALLSYPAEIVS